MKKNRASNGLSIDIKTLARHYSTQDISVRKLICPEIDNLLSNSELT